MTFRFSPHEMGTITDFLREFKEGRVQQMLSTVSGTRQMRKRALCMCSEESGCDSVVSGRPEPEKVPC